MNSIPYFILKITQKNIIKFLIFNKMAQISFCKAMLLFST